MAHVVHVILYLFTDTGVQYGLHSRLCPQ